MDVIESIIRDLQGLSTTKLVEAARYIHGLSEADQQNRQALLRQTHGVLDAEDGHAFEAAMLGSRRLET